MAQRKSVSHHELGQLFGTDGRTSWHEPALPFVERPGDYCWRCGVVRDDHDDRHAFVPFPPTGYEGTTTANAYDRWCEMCGGTHDGADTAQGFTCAGCGGTTAYAT